MKMWRVWRTVISTQTVSLISSLSSESSEIAEAAEEAAADHSVSVHWLCLCCRLSEEHEITETARQRHLRQHDRVISAGQAVDLWSRGMPLGQWPTAWSAHWNWAALHWLGLPQIFGGGGVAVVTAAAARAVVRAATGAGARATAEMRAATVMRWCGEGWG